MKIWYIKETEKPSSIFEKILLKLKKIFGVIRIKNIDDKIVCILPIAERYKVNNRKIIKLCKKLNKKLHNFNITNIVLSNYLNQIEVLKSSIDLRDISILDGRILFKNLIYETIEYIVKKQNKRMEMLEVSILTNDNNYSNTENIILLSKNVKSLNIITNNIQKFKKVEEYLYNELGIMIKISNNKKKALTKTDIIINMDFSEDIINKYNIPNNCIIINTKENINIKHKRFGRYQY